MAIAYDTEWTETFPGVRHRVDVGAHLGAGAVTMGVVSIAPQGAIPLHTHPVEDAFVIVAGHGECTIGDERLSLREGTGVVVPANSVHGIVNNGAEDLLLVFAWPAVHVARELVADG